jgi:hypothetical protein
MELRQSIIKCGILAAALTIGIGAADAGQKRPVVVELFTSQGCSSCPPANANLIKLSKRHDVLALSFSVTYWDYLGWKDSFGKPEFTKRQTTYEPALGQGSPFTPQMVVDGKQSNVGIHLTEVEALIDATDTGDGPSIDISSQEVRIGDGPAPSNTTDVWLVRYDPNVVNVAVGRGENSGATLPHGHVVRSLERLGAWKGGAASFKVAAAPAGLRNAILVQKPNGGPILSAATD